MAPRKTLDLDPPGIEQEKPDIGDGYNEMGERDVDRSATRALGIRYKLQKYSELCRLERGRWK